MATPKKKRPAKKSKKAAAARTRGLEATKLTGTSVPAAVEAVAARIERDGGTVLATYRDPLGSRWQLLAALPIDIVGADPSDRTPGGLWPSDHAGLVATIKLPQGLAP